MERKRLATLIGVFLALILVVSAVVACQPAPSPSAQPSPAASPSAAPKPAASPTASTAPAATTAAKPIKWILSHGYAVGTKDHPYIQQQRAMLIKKYTEEFTGGRVTVDIYPLGQLYGESEAIEAAQRNDVQIVIPTSAFDTYLKWIQMQAFEGPFTMQQAQGMWTNKAFSDYCEKTFAGINLKYMGWLIYDLRAGKTLFTKKAINSMADLKGLKIRSAGAEQDLWKAAGGSGIMIAESELLGSLQQGVIDGVTWSLSGAVSYNLPKIVPYATQYGYTTWGSAWAVSKIAWDKLPKDIQDIMQTKVIPTVREEYYKWDINETTTYTLQQIKDLGAKYNPPLTDDPAFAKVKAEWRDSWIAKNKLEAEMGLVKTALGIK